MSRMIGKHTQVCRMGNCRCGNAHDSKGRKQERRLAKHREKASLDDGVDFEIITTEEADAIFDENRSSSPRYLW